MESGDVSSVSTDILALQLLIRGQPSVSVTQQLPGARSKCCYTRKDVTVSFLLAC